MRGHKVRQEFANTDRKEADGAYGQTSLLSRDLPLATSTVCAKPDKRVQSGLRFTSNVAQSSASTDREEVVIRTDRSCRSFVGYKAFSRF
jgi:hypothetical protein